MIKGKHYHLLDRHKVSKSKVIMEFFSTLIVNKFNLHTELPFTVTEEVIVICNKIKNSLSEQLVKHVEESMRLVLSPSEVCILFDALLKKLISMVPDVTHNGAITTAHTKFNKRLRSKNGLRRRKNLIHDDTNDNGDDINDNDEEYHFIF